MDGLSWNAVVTLSAFCFFMIFWDWHYYYRKMANLILKLKVGPITVDRQELRHVGLEDGWNNFFGAYYSFLERRHCDPGIVDTEAGQQEIRNLKTRLKTLMNIDIEGLEIKVRRALVTDAEGLQLRLDGLRKKQVR